MGSRWLGKLKTVAKKHYVTFIKSSENIFMLSFKEHQDIQVKNIMKKLAKAALDDRSYRTGNDGSVYVIGIMWADG